MSCVIFRVHFPPESTLENSRETSAEDVTVAPNFFHSETNVAAPFVFPTTVFPFSSMIYSRQNVTHRVRPVPTKRAWFLLRVARI